MQPPRNQTSISAIVSASEPDWTREDPRYGWSAGRALIATLRSYQKHHDSSGSLALILKKIAAVRHRYWSAVTGADIPLNCSIGGGLQIPHPNGIVIHPESRIGPNCLIFQQVTIGASTMGVPTIGGHVDIGAGAKIIGPVVIGNHVRIGANAVVHFDVPDGSIVAAEPARIVKSEQVVQAQETTG